MIEFFSLQKNQILKLYQAVEIEIEDDTEGFTSYESFKKRSVRNRFLDAYWPNIYATGRQKPDMASNANSERLKRLELFTKTEDFQGKFFHTDSLSTIYVGLRNICRKIQQSFREESVRAVGCGSEHEEDTG